MLRITIPETELFDESANTFLNVKSQTLALEHSLVSLSKWEAKWCKPYLTNEAKSIEEILDYVRCMTITQNVNPNVYKCLTNEHMAQINDYIQKPMTAAWFSDNHTPKTTSEQITSDIIYYYMIRYGIPFECQKWHLNRLMTLIRVCGEKNKKPKKMGKRDTISRYRAINAARRKRLNTRG